MIAPTPFFSHRGTHIRILEEARALEKRGHEITILTYHVGDDIHSYIDTKIDVRRVRRWLFWYKKTTAGGAGDWQKVILDLFLIRKALWFTFKWKPDIIHGHLHEGVIIGKIARHFFFWRKHKLVADFHGSLVGEMDSHGYFKMKILSRIFRFVESMINQMGDASIVSSADLVSTIRDARRDRRVYHIYDGVDVENYDSLNAGKDVLKKGFGVPSGHTVVAYTGGLVENKGIHHFLEASLVLLKENHKYFFIVGGDYATWIEDFVQQNSIEKDFAIIHPLNYFSLPKVNSLADITVDPKDVYSKQASGKILQYMAACTATVCADRSTNRRYLGDAGSYVAPVNSETLARAISHLAHEETHMHRVSEQAYIRSKDFSWLKVGEKLEGVYLSV